MQSQLFIRLQAAGVGNIQPKLSVNDKAQLSSQTHTAQIAGGQMAHTQPQTFLQLWHKLQKVVTKHHPRQGHCDFLKHLFVQAVRSPQQLCQRKNQ